MPLALMADDPASSAVLTDFDGTVAPIVDDPASARALPGVATTLASLARHFGRVAVISGRPVAFLADRLVGAGPSVVLVGLYGLQWAEDGRIVQAPDVEPWLDAVAQVVDRALVEAPPGLVVEAKGASVALHWRSAPALAWWATEFGRDCALQTGLHLQPGRMTLELRPPVPTDKGVVVERLVGDSRAACFFGDDSGDLVAFDALDALAERGCRTVRVAVAAAESPPELARRADLVLVSPADALAALAALAAVVGGG